MFGVLCVGIGFFARQNQCKGKEKQSQDRGDEQGRLGLSNAHCSQFIVFVIVLGLGDDGKDQGRYGDWICTAYDEKQRREYRDEEVDFWRLFAGDWLWWRD